MCTVVSLPHIPMWISWGWTLIRLQLTWRYPDHRRDLGPETWRNVHWQIEKATVLGEGYLRLRIRVLHDRLIYYIYIYLIQRSGSFSCLLSVLHIRVHIYNQLYRVKSCILIIPGSAKVHLKNCFPNFPGSTPDPEMAILPPPPTMPSFHTSPVLAPVPQQSFWPQQSWAPGTLGSPKPPWRMRTSNRNPAMEPCLELSQIYVNIC